MTHVSFVEKAAACCPCMAFDGFWAEDVAKRQQKGPRSHFKQNFRNKAVVADMRTAPAKNMAQKSIRKKLQSTSESFHFVSSNQPEGSSWVPGMALYLWTKNLTKIRVIFYPKRRLQFFDVHDFCRGSFSTTSCGSTFAKPFFSRRFVVFFFWF